MNPVDYIQTTIDMVSALSPDVNFVIFFVFIGETTFFILLKIMLILDSSMLNIRLAGN